MADVVVLIAAVNADLLYEQLAAGGFPGMASVMSPSGDEALPVQVTIHFEDGASQNSIDAAVAIVRAHDANGLSSAQQAAQAAQAQQVTLKGELTTIQGRLATFNAASFADVNQLAGDLAVLVGAIVGLY